MLAGGGCDRVWRWDTADAGIDKLASGLPRNGYPLVPVRHEVRAVEPHNLYGFVQRAWAFTLHRADALRETAVQRMKAAIEIVRGGSTRRRTSRGFSMGNSRRRLRWTRQVTRRCAIQRGDENCRHSHV